MSNFPKSVQIPVGMFLDLLDYFSTTADERSEIWQNEIRLELEKKYDAIIRREIFSRYKNAEPDTADREKFRKLYLLQAQISKNFQSSKEISEDDYPF